MTTQATSRTATGWSRAQAISRIASGHMQPVGNELSDALVEMLPPEAKVPLTDAYGIIAAANIPKRHNWKVPRDGDERTEQWWSTAERICQRIGTGCLLALLGPRGTGKTQAAVGAIGYGAKARRTALYAKAFDVFLDVRATYTRQDVSERDALDRYIKPDTLVLDEVQQRGETVFEDRTLAYLIDRRYDDMKDTLLIGNLTAEALTESLDPSIVDRLRETGGILEFKWESFRSVPVEAKAE